MDTEKEDWQNGQQAEGTDANQDGNTVNYQRPHRPRFNPNARATSSYRPHYGNEYNGNTDSDGNTRPYRPRFNPNNRTGEGGGYRPRYNNGGENRYNNNGEDNGGARPYRPRFNSNGRPGEGGGYRPRYNNGGENHYNNNGENRYNNGGDENGGARPYRPRYNSGNREGGYRPRYNNNNGDNRYNNGGEDNGGARPYRPRYNSGNREGGYRPRYNNNGGGNRQFNGYNSNDRYSVKKQIEYKEQNVDPNEPIRLNKYLANAGVCSRREADEYIQAGVVSVNGTVVTELGTKIKRSDEVKFHEDPVKIERKVYVLLNKPKNCVTTSDDPQERNTVMDIVKDACKERIYPVGRLDRNTTGVLLLTNDGDLASKLTHPKYLKKKIYHVTLDKNVTRADLDTIVNGVTLDDGEIHADAAEFINEEKKNEIGIEIHSGKNRIVRRIFESLGYKVLRLDRVFFAGLTKKGLRRGDWRYLTEQELNFLQMGSFE